MELRYLQIMCVIIVSFLIVGCATTEMSDEQYQASGQIQNSSQQDASTTAGTMIAPLRH